MDGAMCGMPSLAHHSPYEPLLQQCFTRYGVLSLQDISMQSGRLESAFGLKFKPFRAALQEIFLTA